MAVEHSALTGAQLHEPKGAATAAGGTVYTADGAGSGTWKSPTSVINNLNKFSVETTLTDVGTASSVYLNSPNKATLTRLNVILYGTIDADTVLSIYIDGVLFSQSLTLVAAGSSAGQKQSLTITTANTVPAGGIVTVTSNGATTTITRADIQLEFSAVA